MNVLSYDFVNDNWRCHDCNKAYSNNKAYDLYFDNDNKQSDFLNEQTFIKGTYCVICGEKFNGCNLSFPSPCDIDEDVFTITSNALLYIYNQYENNHKTKISKIVLDWGINKLKNLGWKIMHEGNSGNQIIVSKV